MNTIANRGQHRRVTQRLRLHPFSAMLPAQQYSSASATGGIIILDPHAKASQEKHLDMPEPFSSTFIADQSRGQPIQKMVLEPDELAEDAHLDEQINTLDVVAVVSDFVGTLFMSAFLRPMKHLGLLY